MLDELCNLTKKMIDIGKTSFC